MCRLVNVSTNGDVQAFMFWFKSLTSLWHTQNTEITAFSPPCSPKHMAPLQATSASCLVPWLPVLPHFWSEIQLSTSYRWAPGVLLGSVPDALPSPRLPSWSLHSLPSLHIVFSTPTPKLQDTQKSHAYSSLPRVFLLLVHQHYLKPSAPVYHPIIDNVKKQTYLVATKKVQNYTKYNRLCWLFPH